MYPKPYPKPSAPKEKEVETVSSVPADDAATGGGGDLSNIRP